MLTTAQAQALLPPAAPPRVTLERPGAAPRKLLRYQWPRRATAVLTVETVVGTTVERGGARQVQPPSQLRLRLSLRATPEPDGAATLQVQVLGPAAGDRSGDSTADLAAYRAIASAQSSLRLDARGIPLSAWSPLQMSPGQQLRADGTSQALQIWASVRDALADAFVPLPTEPVGQGARWRSLDRVSRGGAPMLRSAEHQLRLDDEGVVQVETSQREVALAGLARDAALPADIEVKVLAGVGRGRRTLRRAADDWLPLGAEGELAADLDLELAGPGAAAERTAVQLTQLWSLRPARAQADAGAP